ncbi:MAG TPA: ABC transporter ATP-binding protein [Gemmatimonadota bacterium]|jgi:ABC-type Mn2+/Zn2+ transport system ATPase subunit|nr:ABC transporter ATP-binding protein [Gemmatimonadota bacterium]
MTSVPGGAALVRFDAVGLGYGGVRIIEGLTFSVAKGDFLGIVGPNGAGKSTILKAMLGILRPAAGAVVYEAEVHRDLRFGYVPQRHTLDHIYPLSVHAIVRMARYARAGLVRRPGPDDDRAVTQALESIDIVDLAERRFGELSGGQRQRALIARALASGANFLVLDEPTDGMDLKSTHGILGLMRRLNRDEGLTVVFVSHQLNEVANYVDRLLVIDEGRYDFGPVEEVLTADHLRRIYQVPVVVDRVAGASVVVVPR